VRLDEITGKHLSSSNTTVVRTLRSGETVLGPSEDLSIGVEESVLLLETEPRLVLLGGVHDLLGVSSVVGLVDGSVVVVALAQNEDVVTTSEGILEHGDGSLACQLCSLNEDICGSRGRHPNRVLALGWLMNRQSSTL
jgi:hypothetical protein